jgi:hypothetical protein
MEYVVVYLDFEVVYSRNLNFYNIHTTYLDYGLDTGAPVRYP